MGKLKTEQEVLKHYPTAHHTTQMAGRIKAHFIEAKRKVLGKGTTRIEAWENALDTINNEVLVTSIAAFL